MKVSQIKKKAETSWRKGGDWKARYTRLYSSKCLTVPSKEPEPETNRISFMCNNSTPYSALLMRMRASRQNSDGSHTVSNTDTPDDPEYFNSILSQHSDSYSSARRSVQSDDLGGHETKLLDLVRAQSKQYQEEAMEKTLNIPKDEEDDDDKSSEACVHVLSMRATERSVSRSRVSRISTRRDMDIPSILAFTASIPSPVALEIPAFKKTNNPSKTEQDIPRWSIRRSVCPVCSQKWKDKSSIKNVKYSGLKRVSNQELPTVIAPARLRASITMAYVPRPALPVVDEDLPGFVIKRNTSATWQLTRARRFRAPKPQPPEATAPPIAAAPLAQKDLDLRVHTFLKDITNKY